MMKDMHHNLEAEFLIPPATYNADNAPPAIDLKGYDACEIILSIGAGGITFSGANKVEFVLTESDDDSVYTEVTAEDINGLDTVSDGIIKALVSAHAAAGVYRFGYRGYGRYLKLLADFSGTHGTGTPICAVAVKRSMMNATAEQV